MDQPAGQSQVSRGQTPAQRDMMFCHECEDEWYRDEHGLTCRRCGSDFTEIIEEDNDPRENQMLDHDDDDDSMPSLEELSPHLHPAHNPWQDDDPEEGDISNLRFTRVGPSRFNIQATFHRSISPQDIGRGGQGPNPIGGFAALLSGLVAAGRPGQQPQQQQNQDQDQDHNQNQGQAGQPGDGRGTPGSQSGPRVQRFTYTGGARLFPRDADHPGPHMEPVDELNNVLASLMAAFGAPPDAQVHGHAHAHAHNHDHDDPHDPQLNPLLQLFTHMGMIPGNGQPGDFVYSQEGLDRIISQLMEQTATSNAPGPATQDDISKLPRKQVTQDMLGAEGRAECSICMDEVNIGEEVTELPCKHWFHHQCVAAWLGEHDTCPHCRKGISKRDENAVNNASHNISSGGQASSGAEVNFAMPGAFTVAGEGTPPGAFVTPDAAAQNNPQSSSQQGNTQQESSSHGGISERLRRGLFGPHS